VPTPSSFLGRLLMRVPMIATRDMTYATRQLRADEPFEASRTYARVLTALGRARLIEAKEEPEEAPKKSAPAKRARKSKAKG
jgi:hypothetical protein